jgi:hypothetical protein
MAGTGGGAGRGGDADPRQRPDQLSGQRRSTGQVRHHDLGHGDGVVADAGAGSIPQRDRRRAAHRNEVVGRVVQRPRRDRRVDLREAEAARDHGAGDLADRPRTRDRTLELDPDQPVGAAVVDPRLEVDPVQPTPQRDS